MLFRKKQIIVLTLKDWFDQWKIEEVDKIWLVSRAYVNKDGFKRRIFKNKAEVIAFLEGEYQDLIKEADSMFSEFIIKLI